MSTDLVCWKCGASLKAQPLPLGRRSECLSCGAELHVCRLCRHYDTAKAKQCRERAADEVQNKTRANFCDWFQPKADAFSAEAAGNKPAGNPLDTLFGSDTASPPKSDTRNALDKLFGKD
jgi:ribosome-binding protein aMBF1 (putative translation factor)